MPRQVRIEFPGAFYHAMARGDRREPIVTDDTDRTRFVETLAEACERTGWRVHAYALMGNHYHLLIETPQPNLVKGMTWLQATYTARFNARHRLRGHLFSGRYKAVLVQHGEGDYFRTLLDYVHLNPVRASLVTPAEGLDAYPWTSLSYYRLPPSKREPWQEATAGLSSAGFRDTAAGRRKFLEALEWRAQTEDAASAGHTEIEGQSLQSTLRRGWYFGTQAFRERLLALAGNALGRKRRNANYHGSDVHAHGEQHAIAMIDRALMEFDLTAADLPELPKTDWRKALIAHAIKRQTSVKQTWIATHLHMGAPSGISRCTSEMARRLDGKRDRRLRATYKRVTRPI